MVKEIRLRVQPIKIRSIFSFQYVFVKFLHHSLKRMGHTPMLAGMWLFILKYLKINWLKTIKTSIPLLLWQFKAAHHVKTHFMKQNYMADVAIIQLFFVLTPLFETALISKEEIRYFHVWDQKFTLPLFFLDLWCVLFSRYIKIFPLATGYWWSW